MKHIVYTIALVLSYIPNVFSSDRGGRLEGVACFERGQEVYFSDDVKNKLTPFGELAGDYKGKENVKTGDLKYDFGEDKLCVVRNFKPKLTCIVNKKIVFQSKYADIRNFEAERRGFVLQSRDKQGGVSVYTFAPGNVVCTSL